MTKCPTCGYEYKPGKYEYMALAEFCPNGHSLRTGSSGVSGVPGEMTMLGYALDAHEVLATFPHYEFDALNHVLQERLKKMGMVTLSGALRLSRLAECFVRYYDQEFLAKLDCEFDLNSSDNWLFRAFRHLRRAISPVKAMLVIRFLFGSFQEFVRNFNYRYEPFGPGPWPCFNKASDHFGENRINSFTTKVVESVVTGRFGCDCGFTYTRKASSQEAGVCKISKVLNYGPIWNNELMKLKREGKLSIDAIAKKLGVAKSTVSNHLRKASLPLAKNKNSVLDCDTEDVREKHRAVLTALMESNHYLTRTRLRQLARGTYDWLWKNDRQWMECNIPKAVRAKATTGKRGSEVWNAHDEALRQKVEKAASDLRDAPGRPERITKRKIFVLLGLGTSYHVVGETRLPRTNELLNKAVESIEDFELRKVLWSVNELARAGTPVTKYRIRKTAGISRERPSTEKAITDALTTILQEGGHTVE